MLTPLLVGRKNPGFFKKPGFFIEKEEERRKREQLRNWHMVRARSGASQFCKKHFFYCSASVPARVLY
ncbi:hypothetical protein, partial [Microcoleus sp. D3_18a_C4]